MKVKRNAVQVRVLWSLPVAMAVRQLLLQKILDKQKVKIRYAAEISAWF